MEEKLTVDDKSWFETTYFKGIKTLGPLSDVPLRVVAIFYPLPKLTQLLLSVSLLCIGATPVLSVIFLKDTVMNGSAMTDAMSNMMLMLILLLALNVCLIPGHLMLRSVLIKKHYQLAGKQYLHINSDRLSLPVNRLINESQGQLILTRHEITNIDIVYSVQTHKGGSNRNVNEIKIHQKSGKVLELNSLHYPLKHLFYLLVYFGYPCSTIWQRFSFKNLFKVVFLVFPTSAHFMMTCYSLLLVTPFRL